MSLMEILNDLKGKALDAAHFDLLKHAYELQDKNMEQLEKSNAGLEKENQCLKEKVQQLSVENVTLNEELKKYRAEKAGLRKPKSYKKLSVVAQAILDFYLRSDMTTLDDSDIFGGVGGGKYSKIEISTAMDELKTAKLLDSCSYNYRTGVRDYFLTKEGLTLLAKRKKQNR